MAGREIVAAAAKGKVKAARGQATASIPGQAGGGGAKKKTSSRANPAKQPGGVRGRGRTIGRGGGRGGGGGGGRGGEVRSASQLPPLSSQAGVGSSALSGLSALGRLTALSQPQLPTERRTNSFSFPQPPTQPPPGEDDAFGGGGEGDYVYRGGGGGGEGYYSFRGGGGGGGSAVTAASAEGWRGADLDGFGAWGVGSTSGAAAGTAPRGAEEEDADEDGIDDADESDSESYRAGAAAAAAAGVGPEDGSDEEEEDAVPCTEGEDADARAAGKPVGGACGGSKLPLMTAMSRLPAMAAPDDVRGGDGAYHPGGSLGGGGGSSQRGGRVDAHASFCLFNPLVVPDEFFGRTLGVTSRHLATRCIIIPLSRYPV